MRTPTLIFLGTFATAVGAFAIAVALHSPTEYYNVVLVDRTDTLRVKPDAKRIFSLLNWDNTALARTFRVRTITDVDHGDVTEQHLDACNIPFEPKTWQINKNDFIRQGEVDAFNDSVRNTIRASVSGRTWYPRTSLWRALVEELIEMQKRPTAIRSIEVYSDLTEFDSESDFLLDKTALQRLKNDDPAIWQSIPGTSALHNLRDVHVTFTYMARDNTENLRYRRLSSYLERRLQSLGAIVSIQGNSVVGGL